MGTRYGRRRADGVTEYHDSEQSVLASREREKRFERAVWFGLIGAVSGLALGFYFIQPLEFPKIIKFLAIGLTSTALAWLSAKLSNFMYQVVCLGLLLLAGILIITNLWHNL